MSEQSQQHTEWARRMAEAEKALGAAMIVFQEAVNEAPLDLESLQLVKAELVTMAARDRHALIDLGCSEEDWILVRATRDVPFRDPDRPLVLKAGDYAMGQRSESASPWLVWSLRFDGLCNVEECDVEVFDEAPTAGS